MTAAQAWREMLRADQALFRARQGARATTRTVQAATDARAAFSEALGVWERAA